MLNRKSAAAMSWNLTKSLKNSSIFAPKKSRFLIYMSTLRYFWRENSNIYGSVVSYAYFLDIWIFAPKSISLILTFFGHKEIQIFEKIILAWKFKWNGFTHIFLSIWTLFMIKEQWMKPEWFFAASWDNSYSLRRFLRFVPFLYSHELISCQNIRCVLLMFLPTFELRSWRRSHIIVLQSTKWWRI